MFLMIYIISVIGSIIACVKSASRPVSKYSPQLTVSTIDYKMVAVIVFVPIINTCVSVLAMFQTGQDFIEYLTHQS